MKADVEVALAELEAKIQSVKAQIDTLSLSSLDSPNPTAFAEFEENLVARSRELAALIAARELQKLILSEGLDDAINSLIECLPGKFRNIEWRSVGVSFIGGVRIQIVAPYYAKRSGRATGKGFYPHLAVLGIFERVTPALASMVARYAAAMSSFEEARSMLADQGVTLNIKTIRSITKAFAARARAGQRIAAAAGKNDPKTNSKDSRTVIVSTDGGRIRVRRKKRGKRRKKQKRQGYHADWREPKMIIIYVIDDQGRMNKTIPPIIDATLAGPESAFALLEFYLKQIEITDNDEVSFIADGARWIWERVSELFERIGVSTTKVVELLDFYHVVEHLSEIARLKARWTTRRRRQWVRKLQKWLLGGKHDDAIAEIRNVTAGAKNNLLKRERSYFVKNQSRLAYGPARSQKRPIGSGAVESAIRRVINLRLKGPGIMWLEETASEMLFLRCFFKAGRWGQIEKWARCPLTVGI